MASRVEICNLALTRIAAQRIISFDDGTIEAKDCSALYELLAQEVMADGSWPSVKKRASLAQLSTTPAFGYTYAYQLPNDCLKVLMLNECKPGEVAFEIEGNTILCSESAVSIRYLSYITDTNSYDIWLRQAIVDRLVAELVYKKTASISNYQNAIKYYHDHAKMLLAEAALASNAQDINSDTFIDARRGLGGYSSPQGF